MSGAKVRVHPQPRATITPAPRALVQRQCDCVGKARFNGECEKCREKRLAVQRKPRPDGNSPGNSSVAPSIVHEVMRSPGRPMDPETRENMESRFGHDFSRVRVHTDSRAADSARDIRARAFTVGRNVVFGTGQYNPGTDSGRQLLAHELTHTLQQGLRSPASTESLEIRPANDSLELEARRMSSLKPVNGDPTPTARSGLSVQRNGDPIEIDLVPVSPLESERLRQEQGIDLPGVSEETYRAIGGDRFLHAGESLSEAEQTRVEELTQQAPPQDVGLSFTEGPRFVLHDTAANVGSQSIQRLQQQGRGPLGKGATVFVPRSDPLAMIRPRFFETRRPTASEFEKGQDILSQGAREREYRNVWAATGSAAREQGMNRALGGLGLTPQEVSTEETRAQTQLNARSGDVWSTALWTVNAICDEAASSGAESVAASENQTSSLTTACGALQPLFQARQARIGSSTNIEIVQQPGSHCATSDAQVQAYNRRNPGNPIPGSRLVPLPNPPYSDNQYDNVSLLYLRAAQEARRFPEVTTHFLIDRNIGDHCDPRCFDLHRLYSTVETLMGHAPQSTYGITPRYGTRSPANVWWLDRVCNGSPPTGAGGGSSGSAPSESESTETEGEGG